MSIKNAFIPCAGKGTRMGDIGKEIAKPLWKIFDKSMLEVQTSYLKSFFSIENFYINTHHLSDQFTHLEDISISQESVLLGSGGNINKLKNDHPDLNKVIIINPDINLFLSNKDIERLKEAFKENDFVMVCLRVPAKSNYNEVNTFESIFSHVTGPNHKRDYLTYSGFGMINLSKLDYVSGESSFFDTVVTDRSNCFVFTPNDPYEYWDWGTLEQYIKNIKDISSLSYETKMRNHLIDIGAIDTSLLTQFSYRSEEKNSYNFTNDLKTSKADSIIISYKKDKPFLIKI